MRGSPAGSCCLHSAWHQTSGAASSPDSCRCSVSGWLSRGAQFVGFDLFAHLAATHLLIAVCADPSLPGSHRHPETPRHNVAATRQFMQQYSLFAASHGAATLQKQSMQASASLPPTPRAKPVQSAPLQLSGSQSSRGSVHPAHTRVRFAAPDAGSTAQLQGEASLLAEAPAA